MRITHREFCVSVSGFRVGDPVADVIFGHSYSTPTLHVLGKNDVIVVEERSQKLIQANSSPRVEMHDGGSPSHFCHFYNDFESVHCFTNYYYFAGHFVPSQTRWRKFFREYLKNPAGNIPSPALSGVHSSGKSTPTGADRDCDAFPHTSGGSL